MENKDEVHSDDGSYELVDIDNDRVGLSDEDSYDLLSSDFSDTPEEDEADSKNTTVNDDNISAKIESFSPDQPNDDPGLEDSTNSDFSSSNSDFSEEEVEEEKDCSAMGKKRNFITMAMNVDLYVYPTHIKLKGNITIKELAKEHILRYLPAKSLARCQLVSKEWESWISTPFFAHTQSQYFSQTSGFFQDDNDSQTLCFISLDRNSYGVPHPSLDFLPTKVSIRSSCNGLLLSQSILDENEYYICNPANKEFIQLPYSDYYHGKEPKPVLAFEPSSLNFKPSYQVICPFSVLDEGPILYFDIYDSNTKSWRVSDEICVDLDENDIKSDGFFVNGVVYWETKNGELLAFDSKNEIYGVQKLPSGGALSKVRGELCYVKGHYSNFDKTCVLGVYSGGAMSLKSRLRLKLTFRGVEDAQIVECSVLGNSCDDVVVFILKTARGQNCLFVYRMKERKVEGPWFPWRSAKLFPYVNSLVSIAV